MIIEDTASKQSYEFACNQWLAKDEGDGLTTRELSCRADPNKNKPAMKKQSVVETDVSQISREVF